MLTDSDGIFMLTDSDGISMLTDSDGISMLTDSDGILCWQIVTASLCWRFTSISCIIATYYTPPPSPLLKFWWCIIPLYSSWRLSIYHVGIFEAMTYVKFVFRLFRCLDIFLCSLSWYFWIVVLLWNKEFCLWSLRLNAFLRITSTEQWG